MVRKRIAKRLNEIESVKHLGPGPGKWTVINSQQLLIY